MDRPSTVDARASVIRGGLPWLRSAHPWQVSAVEAPNTPAATSAILTAFGGLTVAGKT